MRQFGILLILGVVLALIAWQARTGIFRRHSPTDQPANKYMRQVMENPQLTTEDAAILRERYHTAHTAESGLRYLVVKPGQGPVPHLGDELTVHYTGTLLDGTKFDSSRDKAKPFVFRLGSTPVIKGWEEALATMKKGERRTLIIPWWLGYGEEGKGPIPGKATLVFDVELLDFH